MANEVKRIADFNGLLPLLDRKRVGDPYVVDGRNFLVDLDGPYSAFGRELITNDGFLEPAGIQSLRIGNAGGSFFFTCCGILRYDADANQLIPVYHFEKLDTILPFTGAAVGGLQYYARLDIGLLQYNPTTRIWKKIVGEDVPADICAVTQAGSRCVVITPTLIAWSEIDNGEAWTPSLLTGAGAQSLSLVSAAARGLTVINYPGGFLTYTTGGIVRSEVTNTPAQFRHTVLSRKHVPVNAWCAVYDDQNEQHVFLSRSGLFATDGFQIPEVWQPPMSEFLRREIIPKTDLNRQALVRLDYNFTRSWFYLSISDNNVEGQYTRALTLYTPSDKWGVFNKVHSGITEIFFNSGPLLGYQLGYVDLVGTLWRYNDNAFDRVYPGFDPNIGDWTYDFRKVVEYPPRNDTVDATEMSAVLRMTGVDESRMYQLDVAGIYDLRTEVQESEATQSPNPIPTVVVPATFFIQFYDAGSLLYTSVVIVNNSLVFFLSDGTQADIPLINGKELPFNAGVVGVSIDATAYMGFAAGFQQFIISQSRAESAQEPLDSFIEFGPLRIFDERGIDILSMVDEIQLSNLDIRVDDQFEDYIADYSEDVFEDWNTLTTVLGADIEEDWGFGIPDTSKFSVSVRGTIDAYNTWENQERAPDIIETDRRTIQYASDIPGLYNLIKMFTAAIGDSYHLKTAEINLIDIGKYT